MRQEVQDGHPCGTCLRWPECNGVDWPHCQTSKKDTEPEPVQIIVQPIQLANITASTFDIMDYHTARKRRFIPW